MADYKWTFANVGGAARVCVKTGEDIRHLVDLDEKLWTVLSCPTTGLEIAAESLQLMDTDGDGKLRVKEVKATTAWLCQVLNSPDVLIPGGEAELALDAIKDEAILAVAKKVAGESAKVNLAQVDAAIAGATIEAQAAPAAPVAPLSGDIIAAYKAKKEEYAAYFEQEKLAGLGLAVIAADAVKPGMEKEAFEEMGAKIAAYDAEVAAHEAAVAAVNAANAAALAAAQAEYQPLRKLLLLVRDYYRLVRNFVTFDDFYGKGTQAMFQAGTLIIDQRACKMCMRVNEMPKHTLQAPASGMYLLYCDCENKKLGQKMQIVAAVTVGDVRNLAVGKNAIFYDNKGNDWDAVVTKIIDNPISIGQAFFSPYRKLGNYVADLVNKRAAQKESQGFADMTAKVQSGVDNKGAEAKPAAAPFDIAKFTGMFAAISLGLGALGGALASVASGLAKLAWWQVIVVIVGVFLVISGPSMFLAWMKLRKRNLAPVLNANGWAVNAEVMVSVLFGATLTNKAQFPLLNMVDPSVKKGMPRWAKWVVGLLIVGAVIAAAVYFGVCPCCGE